MISLAVDPSINAYLGLTHINLPGLGPDPPGVTAVGGACLPVKNRTCLLNIGADTVLQTALVKLIIRILL